MDLYRLLLSTVIVLECWSHDFSCLGPNTSVLLEVAGASGSRTSCGITTSSGRSQSARLTSSNSTTASSRTRHKYGNQLDHYSQFASYYHSVLRTSDEVNDSWWCPFFSKHKGGEVKVSSLSGCPQPPLLHVEFFLRLSFKGGSRRRERIIVLPK